MQRDDRGYAVGGRIYSITYFLYNKSSDKSHFKSSINISNLNNFNKSNETIFDKDFSKNNGKHFKNLKVTNKCNNLYDIYNDNFNENCEDIKINELLLNQSERNLRRLRRN